MCVAFFVKSSTVKAQTISQYSGSAQTQTVIDNGVTEDNYDKNIQGVTPISLTQYLQKISDGDKFIAYIGFKECPHCRKFSPVLNKFIQEANQPVYYLDYGPTGTFTTATKNMLDNFYSSFNQPFEFAGTPTVALYNKGKLLSMTVGDDTTLDDLQHILQDSRYN
ncbi:PedC/BrcD family bacteriocin maturation disulfide isomerase [Agrilactobacillus fermenti]|uniref:PedC/BrcD family bacteriocin maturation disulfide isomerase n=1 Tax=Agrilactobacillus fermenti TaxID=2586909 RepID=UPI003A5B92CE